MKRNFSAKCGVAHHFGDLLQDTLAGFVVRMGLAGKEELHGALGVVDHGGETFDVFEQQVGALIGSEAAGEADGEGVGRQSFGEALERSDDSLRRSACSTARRRAKSSSWALRLR